MDQRVLKRIAGTALPIAAFALAVTAGLAKPQGAHAESEAEAAEKRERCATRLAVALLGESASADLLAAKDPQARVDAMLADDAFIERFSRFANAKLNPEPGEELAEDATYTLSKHVLSNDKPWKDLFVGKYAVADEVTEDPDGLGYFRSEAWMRRYAGNEEDGYRIVAAYQILQNTTGLKLIATTNTEDADLSATGRKANACKSCHYDNWYALDSVAKILSKRRGMGNNMTFVEPDEGPQKILGGKTIANDGELVAALVESENFRFSTCRLAFEFLYSRPESTCEAAVFDKCVDAFDAAGTMQSAVSAIAKDPSFCQ
jgi:hypothetical protein